MTTTLAPLQIDGLNVRDALCIAPDEDLAMEVAAWLYKYAEGRRAFFPGRLCRIIDATGDPAIGGYLVFWPNVGDRAYWPLRSYQRQDIAREFAGRGLRLRTAIAK